MIFWKDLVVFPVSKLKCLETGKRQNPLNTESSLNMESVWKQENYKILWIRKEAGNRKMTKSFSWAKTWLTRGTDRPFRCLDAQSETPSNYLPIVGRRYPKREYIQYQYKYYNYNYSCIPQSLAVYIQYKYMKYRGPICRQKNGAQFATKNISEAQFGEAKIFQGPICLGPICRGPICRGPICLGPICLAQFAGPDLPGLNLLGPNLPHPNLFGAQSDGA